MVDNSNFSKLTALIKENNGRLIIAGDRYQHPSIRAGKPYILLQEGSNIEIIEMKESVRPQTEIMKSVFKDLQESKFFEAIQKIQNSHGATWLDLALNKDQNILDQVGDAFADAFLNLKPDIRDKTCAIIPAHILRDNIHPKIRAGLKKEGLLGKADTIVQTLRPKRNTLDEMRQIEKYRHDIQVIRMNGKYFEVDRSSVDISSKSVMMTDSKGNSQPFFPEKIEEKNPIAFYEKKELPLASGDHIRLTESANGKNKISNATYRIESVSDAIIKAIPIEQKGDAIELNTKDFKGQHIDYAYTSTSQLAQGMTRSIALTAQLSFFKGLATTQALNINLTRARDRVIVICDNTQLYMNSLHSGEKTSAMQALGVFNSIHTLAAVEKKLVPHYEHLFEGLFSQKTTSIGVSSAKTNDFLVHYDSQNNTFSWTNLQTQAQGEGMLSYIKNKEKMSAAQIQDYGVTILADCQLKREAMEAENQSKHTKPLPKYAQKILSESTSIQNTIAESYLKESFEVNQLPNAASFRFHAKVFCSEDRCYYPAMLVVGKDGQENLSQLTAVFLDNTTDNDIDNNSAIEALHEKTWGDENMHSSIQVHLGDDNVSLVTHTLESAIILQQAQPLSSIIAIDDISRLSPMQLNQNVVLCIEASLVNDPAAQANLISTIETLEACGKHVLLNYLPSHECSGEMYGSIAELVQDKGMEGLKELMDDVRSLDSVMGEVGDVEKSMGDELEELNKTADHHSMEEEKSLNNNHQIDSREQDFEMEL